MSRRPGGSKLTDIGAACCGDGGRRESPGASRRAARAATDDGVSVASHIRLNCDPRLHTRSSFMEAIDDETSGWPLPTLVTRTSFISWYARDP